MRILKGTSIRSIGLGKKVSKLIIISKNIINGLLDLGLLESGRNHWLRWSYGCMLDQLGVYGWKSNGSRLVEVPHWACWLTLLNWWRQSWVFFGDRFLVNQSRVMFYDVGLLLDLGWWNFFSQTEILTRWLGQLGLDVLEVRNHLQETCILGGDILVLHQYIDFVVWICKDILTSDDSLGFVSNI